MITRGVFLVSLLLTSCASRATTRSPEELSRSPRYCGDPVYATQNNENVDTAVALAEIALTEPQAFKCNPASPSDAQHNTQHLQDTGQLQPKP